MFSSSGEHKVENIECSTVLYLGSVTGIDVNTHFFFLRQLLRGIVCGTGLLAPLLMRSDKYKQKRYNNYFKFIIIYLFFTAWKSTFKVHNNGSLGI